jgi:hypothetical protein
LREEEKGHMEPCLENMGFDTPVEYGSSPKVTAQIGPIVLVCCHDELAMHQTFIFLVIYGKFHYG